MSKSSEFLRRRQRLMAEVGAGNLAIIAAAPERLRNGDTPYPYRQDSDFLYLTGFSEPDSVLVLRPGQLKSRPGSDEQRPEQLLFLRPADPERSRWDGPRLGLEHALSALEVDQALPIDALDDHLPQWLAESAQVYALMGRDAAFEHRITEWQTAAEALRPRGAAERRALEPLLHEQRLIKSAAELKTMRRAAAISAQAMMQAMRRCRPGANERDAHAELVHVYHQHGACAAYQPIVAGGRNALILHYIANNAPLPDEGLVLIDAGCEVEGYAADITRTVPVSGRFSGPQRALYDLVLAAHHRAIDCIQAGAPYNAFHDAAVRTLTEGLIDLGLLHGSVDDNLEHEHYRRFYMHKTGHWLGLDVHDVGDYKIDDQWRVLEPNMVLTVEPGLYIGDEPDIPEAFRNIGIRLEDDIRVGNAGPENLTAAVPIEAEDIEQLMRDSAPRTLGRTLDSQ